MKIFLSNQIDDTSFQLSGHEISCEFMDLWIYMYAYEVKHVRCMINCGTYHSKHFDHARTHSFQLPATRRCIRLIVAINRLNLIKFSQNVRHY